MRVAYINCLLSKGGLLGVEKKLSAQARAIDDLGLDMDVFYFNINNRFQGKGIHSCSYWEGPLRQRLAVLQRYAAVPRFVDTDRYDVLVLRYSGGDFSCFSRFIRNNRGRLVTEHHTKELPEAYTYATTFPQKMLTVFMERVLGPRIIKRSAGLIGLTDEIREYELERAGVNIPACTVANGASVQDIPFSKHAPYNGEVLNLLCLANEFSAWYGLDRVLSGLEDYASEKPALHLTMVGGASSDQLNMAERLNQNRHIKVRFLGQLFGSDLEKVFEKTHIAFSSLASFRAKTRDACTLKTREYTARGLPFVIGHRDPDFEGDEGFFLSVPPNNNPVNMDEVVGFAERVFEQKGISESMREYARQTLDWNIKMQAMWDFLKSVAWGRHFAEPKRRP
jgi:hypothetical protein